MPRNKYPEETVKIILDAAMKVFLEKGYEQTTVLDIVGEMGGLTRGAFYHHFKSKEEVLDALGNYLFQQENPFEKAKERRDLTGLEKLRYLAKLNQENSQGRQVSILSLTALNSPTFLKRLIDDNRDVLAPMFQEFIEEGQRDGSIKTQQPQFLAELLTFLTNFWMVPTLYPTPPEQIWAKLLYVKELLEKMGLPLIDQEFLTLLRQQLDSMCSALPS